MSKTAILGLVAFSLVINNFNRAELRRIMSAFKKKSKDSKFDRDDAVKEVLTNIGYSDGLIKNVIKTLKKVTDSICEEYAEKYFTSLNI